VLGKKIKNFELAQRFCLLNRIINVGSNRLKKSGFTQRFVLLDCIILVKLKVEVVDGAGFSPAGRGMVYAFGKYFVCG